MDSSRPLLSHDDAARLLGIEPRRIKQLIRDHVLFQERDEQGRAGIPQEIIVKGEHGWEPLFNLPGTLTLLADCGYSEEETAAWLRTPQDELGQTPLEALLEGRHHRVNNIARLLAF